MTEILTLKTNDTPTLLNRETAVWAFLGNTIGALLGSLVAGPAGILPGRLIGAAALGLFFGNARKKEMARELTEGKPVSTPRYWNSETIIGMLAGAMVGSWLAINSTAVTAVTQLAIYLGGMALGTVLGSKHGHTRMAQEYQQALVQQEWLRRGTEMTPQVVQGVEMVVEKGQDKSFVEKLEAERAQAAQQPVR